MGLKELRESKMYLEEQRQLKKSMAENERRRKLEEADRFREEIDNIKLLREAKFENFYEYKNNVKKTLLKEALLNIYKRSMFNPNKREQALCEALLGSYIEDVGVDQLLKNMKFSKSGLLVSIYEAEEEAYKDITDGASANDLDSQTIDPEKVSEFWKEIDKSEDVEDATNLIRLRVSNAEEEFVNKNQEDKENVKTILKDTADRVKIAQDDGDEDYTNAVKESEERIAKSKIYSIQHEGHRNVFDRMVRNISESVIKNEEIKDEFTLENGRLDMDKIVESARCMYTLLEMVATLNIEDVDAQYIEDTLKSIK